MYNRCSFAIRYSTFAIPRRLEICVACVVLFAATGCSQLISPDTPRPIEKQVEPESGREYLLYRPSSYDRARSWPLIVTCHSGFLSSSSKPLQDWTTVAEEYGALVIAPKIETTRGSLSRSTALDAQGLKADETCILSAIRHVRAGHNISDNRIFIQGHSGAAPSALFTGLRNGELFRAISLSQPRFERGDMTDVTVYIDPHQPVYLNVSSTDSLTGKKGRDCAEWLRAYGADLRLQSAGGANHPQRAMEFFQDVLRKEVWMHVRTAAGDSANPLSIRFTLLCVTPPSRFRWQFSDGDESAVAEPIHVFPKAGKHRVVVTAEWPKFGEHTRYVDVEVPSGVVRPAHGAP